MILQNFDEVIYTHSQHLHPFALKFTKCEHKAKDLVQDTLLLAIRNKQKFTEGSNVKAWLFTIMRNFFINQYRRIKRHRAVFDLRKSVYDASNVTANEAAYCFLNNKDIYCVIRSVPDTFRIPFELFVEGYQYKEIAIITDTTEGTIKSRIHFARKLIKNALAKQDSIISKTGV